jgi:ABC-type nickel/cobalt efflux system permease component RcnA
VTLHGIYFHSWHWVFQQIQLTNWMGNIVAGVVVFCTVSLLWPRTRRALEHYVEAHFRSLHTKIDAQHAERLAQAEAHHREALALAKKQHEAHMRALAQLSNTPKPRTKRTTHA